jgi:cobalt-zinc-cadmium efflux system protein
MKWRPCADGWPGCGRAGHRGHRIRAGRPARLETSDVIGVHDLHAWTITSGVNVLSAHVVVTGEAASGRVLDQLGGCLADHFDIEHSTFQLEPPGHRDHEPILHR